MVAGIFLSFIFSCSPSPKNASDCPPNASGDDCECDANFYRSPTQDDQTRLGECISGLDLAILTGDPTTLIDEEGIIQRAMMHLDNGAQARHLVLESIFGNDPIEYVPSEWSNHIRNVDLERNFIFLKGTEVGHSLAVAGEDDSARRLAFGANVLSLLYGGHLTAFESHFYRSLQWLLTGDPDADAMVVHAVVTGAGWWTEEYRYALTQLNPSWTVSVCDDASTYMSCIESADIWVLGSEGTAEDADDIRDAVAEAQANGLPILYSHTQTWAENAFGLAALSPLGMTFGDYGGNYWSADQAIWGNIGAVLESGGLISDVKELLQNFIDNDLAFDFSHCTEFVGQISCEDVPGIQTEFFAGARAMKSAFNQFDSMGVNLFETDNHVVWKLMALLGDWYRRDIQYPMSKTDVDIMPFFRSYYADHAVLSLRAHNPAQENLGTFSDLFIDDIERRSVEREILLSKHGGFTAAGAYALPGEPFSIQRLSDGPDIFVRLNTQRTGSTREFNDDQYTRPKFLTSEFVPVPKEGPLQVSWPYGGTIQIYANSSDSDSIVSIALDGVGEHAVLWPDTPLSQYQSELEDGAFSMTELYNPYVQIHSQTAMMMEAIEGYGGDLDAFFWDLETYMILGSYNLAGFTGDGLMLNLEVASMCDSLGWACEGEEIHGRPALQHINVDYYAHCGGGCSGNPYDQAWPLGPLGWGETHEIGHNLQRGRLAIYGPRSSEVSNQIFPLYKHAQWFEDTGESLTPERVDFQGAYEMIQNGQQESDSTLSVYDNLWAPDGIYDNNAQRMAFYMQLVYLADQRPDLSSGWDLYTLIYLHERLFSTALNNDWSIASADLGFGTYGQPPTEISGNDFLMISASFILERDLTNLFDAWGIESSSDARSQVLSFGFNPAPLEFYAAENVNDLESSYTRPIDGFSLWEN